MSWTKWNIAALVISVLFGIVGTLPGSASDFEKERDELLIAEISLDRIPRQRSPAPLSVPPPIQPQRDTPRFYCAVNVFNFESLSLYIESGKTFSFDINWGNISHVVADEVEVIVRFWYWSPGVEYWSSFNEAPVSYNYTDVGYMGHRPYGEKLEKELYPDQGGCYPLEGVSHLAHCKYRVTEEVRYKVIGDTRQIPTIGGGATAMGSWVTAAECEKVIEWNYTDQDPSLQLQRDTNRPGGDYRHFELDGSFPELCRNACKSDSRCKAWTYVRPYRGQGSKAHCWLKDTVPRSRDDDCCISGVKQ